MTRVVSDSGLLTHHWQIGQWQTFRTFDAICVPGQVAREIVLYVSLAQMPALAGRDITVVEVSEQEIAAVRQTMPANLILHEADLAALALARRQLPDLVLTDDLATRQAVEAQGQMPMGSVGLLLRAYKAGLLDAAALDHAIDGLFVHSTLYFSPQCKAYARRLIVKNDRRIAATGQRPGGKRAVRYWLPGWSAKLNTPFATESADVSPPNPYPRTT